MQVVVMIIMSMKKFGKATLPQNINKAQSTNQVVASVETMPTHTSSRCFDYPTDCLICATELDHEYVYRNGHACAKSKLLGETRRPSSKTL